MNSLDKGKAEITAIRAGLRIMEKLDPEARTRVLDYIRTVCDGGTDNEPCEDDQGPYGPNIPNV